ncbi:MAG TPA: hypothetical protein VF941_11850 [Clostridia bacterium]
MEKIILSETEVAYIVDILWKYSFYDQKILDIIHILTMKFPTLKEEAGEESDEERIQGISKE